MEYILTVTFICTDGSKGSLSISGVKSTITKDEISALMDTIISTNIFITTKGAFIEKSSADITERTVTSYEF